MRTLKILVVLLWVLVIVAVCRPHRKYNRDASWKMSKKWIIKTWEGL